MLGLRTGFLMNEFPYFRMGRGKKVLVIFPPLIDSLTDATMFPAYLFWAFGLFANHFTVYVISRKRHMPVGYTTRDMAADYARVFEQCIGPAHIMGISLGGLIAQYFVIDFPKYVKTLILGMAGYKLGPEAMVIARRWIPWARQKKWGDIYREIIKITYLGFRRSVYTWATPMVESALKKRVNDPSDFIISGQAGLIHDTSEYLHAIEKPTLIIGGTHDVFFPGSIYQETAAMIPGASLDIVQRAGHGAFEEHKWHFYRKIGHFTNQ